jgi:hypothetical protein
VPEGGEDFYPCMRMFSACVQAHCTTDCQ